MALSSKVNTASLASLFEKVPFCFFMNNNLLPLSLEDGELLRVGAVETELDFQILDNLSTETDLQVEIVNMDAGEIEDSLQIMESEVIAGQSSDFEQIGEATLEGYRSQISRERQKLDASEEAPIVSRLNSIIAEAVLREASDIHIEPREDHIKIRLRINGMLHNFEQLPRDILPGIVSRVKVMADLDIAEQLRPQDGRINLDVGNKEIDIRVSVVPTVHGERIVLRILDRDRLKSSLGELGMNSHQLELTRNVLSQSDGIILVTGPTGSGKTTSLYCFLQQLRAAEKNIITLEDPVEYQLEGINQIEIKPKQDLTFASGLRSVLRQDPDIIMVGEIRDRESAKLAVHAALTGHLVFSTLHTRSSLGALNRLIDLGLDRFLIGSALETVMAQRLVRVLCSSCRQKTEEGYYRPAGCEKCRDTGYSGRRALFEILELTPGIRQLIEDNVSEEILRDHLNSSGFEYLKDAGDRLLRKGITSPEEINRVLSL